MPVSGILLLVRKVTVFRFGCERQRPHLTGFQHYSHEVVVSTRALTHVVYARGRSGNAKIFINGRLDRQQLVAGELENWDEQYRLALGNEVSGGRPWLGDLHRVAVYSREWTLGDVQARFARGIDDDGAFSKSVASKKRADFFETEVTPLLSTHCLECHDSATHKGGLDLSRRAAAFKGGDSGKVLFAGNAAQSPLWRLRRFRSDAT